MAAAAAAAAVAAAAVAAAERTFKVYRRRQLLLTGACLPLPLILSGRARAQTEANDADYGFCRDMSIHHFQALAMCQRILGRDTGDLVQAAAAEVLQNQAIEIGHMHAWLADWGQSTVPPTLVMGWMGANGGAGIPLSDMPGYASADELTELSLLTGRERGKRWLELMRAHHVGGVTMASRAQDLVSSDKVRGLASRQVATQTYEIAQYDLLLEGPYASI
ncbi:MAG: DUF305 domain-containing protein [Myxococcota bacterium]